MGSRRSTAGFTLIELMISIALVLALMIGVNYVFSSVGQATGLTQAVSRVTREMQGAQGVMGRDIATADMPNAPFVVIRSSATPAFRDRTDYGSAINQLDPLVDPDNAPGGTHSFASVNNRNHRTDILLFFARDKFARQTGGGTFAGNFVQPYLADMSTQEAMIWYGHLRLPDDNGAFPAVGAPAQPLTNPGAGSLSVNPNNFFANQFMLGRVAITLQEPDTTNKILTKRALKDLAGNSTGAYSTTEQAYIRDAGSAFQLTPLEPLSPSIPPGFLLEHSRYDLAGTSMAKMRQKSYQPDFLGRTMGIRRFYARPFVLGAAGTRLSPVDLALQAPIFLSNCSQFIVEYAGDFVSQDILGNASGPPVPDGAIDYTVENISGNLVRHVRWYGFPRDVDGDGDIMRQDTPPPGNPPGTDVVPLRDYRGSAFPFEEQMDTWMPLKNDYLAQPLTPPIGAPWEYRCAWSPTDVDRPKMFRIIVGVDDPNGRFADPLMFEYVFKVP